MRRRHFLIALMAAGAGAALRLPGLRRVQAQTPSPTLTVWETIQSAPQLHFARLLEASPAYRDALADPTLRWTVLLPTDAAFTEPYTLESLLADEAARESFLAQHIIPGYLRSLRLTTNDGAFLGTLRPGVALRVSASRERFQVEGATVIERDWLATNGVLHTLDAIPAPTVIPAAPLTPAITDRLIDLIHQDMAGDAPVLSGLLLGFQAATDKTLLASLEATSTQMTLFAPTNAAFTALIAREGITAECALEAGNAMTQVFAHHLIPGRFTLADFAAYAQAQPGGVADFITLQGETLTFTAAGLLAAAVTQADQAASNGLLHIVDDVLKPPGL
jgi:uncharacterized surface protein with fasciclin (FAS1) repeats